MTRVPMIAMLPLLLDRAAGAVPGSPPGRGGRPAQPEETSPHSIEASPISFIVRIYAVQYAFELAPSHEVIVGPAYMNIQYRFGETHAPALILGYRYYLWKNLHVEHQIWPVYDWFWESKENRTYRSVDVWNEARAGYRIDFRVAGRTFYLNPQFAFGFGLYASNKPPRFLEEQEKNRFFYAPLVFLGVKL